MNLRQCRCSYRLPIKGDTDHGDDLSLCSPASGPTCRSRPSARRPSSSATTASSSPAGATTSRWTRRSSSDGYVQGRWDILNKYGLKCFAISTPPGRARPCATASTSATRASCRRASGATARQTACAARCAEEMKNTARAAAKMGLKVVHGFTGSPHLAHGLLVPAQPRRLPREGPASTSPTAGRRSSTSSRQEGVKFALEVHPTEIAFDICERREGAEGGERSPGLRLQLRSRATSATRASTTSGSSASSRTASSTST